MQTLTSEIDNRKIHIDEETGLKPRIELIIITIKMYEL